MSRLGFNSELPELATNHYLLGNGYRAYSSVLMRFLQPDSWSPFGLGGLNPYCYCDGEPVNPTDPSGHMPLWRPWAPIRPTPMHANPQRPMSSLVTTAGMRPSRKRTYEQAFGPDEPERLGLVWPEGNGQLQTPSASTSRRLTRSPERHSTTPPRATPEASLPGSAISAARESPGPSHPSDSGIPQDSLQQLLLAIKRRDFDTFNSVSSLRGNGAFSMRVLNLKMPDTGRLMDGRHKFTIGDRNNVMHRTQDLDLIRFLNKISESIRRVR